MERPWHRHYPPDVPAQIDFSRLTMPEWLSRSASRFPHRAALEYMGKKISFAQLNRLVDRFASALISLGVKQGDTVAMLLPNIPQVVVATYATFRIGAIAAMNNPLYTERELSHQLSLSDAKVVVTLDLLEPMVEKLWATTPVETAIFCHINDYLPFPKKQLFPFVKKAMFRKISPGDRVHEFLSLMAGSGDGPVENRPRWEDVGAHLYTGGTTGVSKGAMITHANMSSNAQQLRTWFGRFKDGEEKMLAVFPFFHSAGFTGVQNVCMMSGWNSVLVPRPEPKIIVDLLKASRPTLVPGVPTIYTGLLADSRFTAMDLSFIKGFVAGAAPLPTDVIRRLKDLTGAGIINVYGLTEISPMGCASPLGGMEKPGTVGVPLPNTDVKLVDLDQGEAEVPPGTPGEICFKGPQVMAGYHKRPDETRNAIRDGWLYTGDIGVMDPDGFLSIVDRKKDMIVAGGYNIYPNEVDEILFSHPDIEEACTIGVPDEYRGETVKSFVVVRKGGTLTAEAVEAFCREKMAAYKVPRQVAFVDALPKSAVGKILRKELRRLEGEKET